MQDDKRMAWPYHEFPFIEDRHRTLAKDLMGWMAKHPEFDVVEEVDGPGATRRIVREMGKAGFLGYAVADPASPQRRLDSRSIAIVREILSYKSALADCAFAIQGIGSTPIALFGGEALRKRFLPAFRDGSSLPALAMSEPQSGSDVAGTLTTALEDGDGFVLNGEKTWISNGGIADVYVVIARTSDAPGSRGLSAFVVEAGTPGLEVEPFEVINAHPIATLRFRDCRIPRDNLIGEIGMGFKVAMANLDVFRPSVGACGIGFARRALHETLAHVQSRQAFGKTLSDIETVRVRLADMALELEMATLAVYHAVWATDVLGGKQSHLASIAKLGATEAAQRVIDSAVQLFGGLGVKRGSIIERLYRDVRPIRIGEGASDIQRLIITRHLLGAKPRLSAAGAAGP
jgi:acyl-CoA dehydrogenase